MTRVALLIAVVGATGCGRSASTEPRMLGLIPGASAADALSGERAALLEAKRLIRARKWDEALLALRALQERSPVFAEGMVEAYILAVQKEVNVEQRVRKANAHLDAHELVPAANEIAWLTDDTQQADDLAQVKARIAIEVTQLVVEGHVLMGGLADPEKRTRLIGICDMLVRVAPGEKSLPIFQAAVAKR